MEYKNSLKLIGYHRYEERDLTLSHCYAFLKVNTLLFFFLYLLPPYPGGTIKIFPFFIIFFLSRRIKYGFVWGSSFKYSLKEEKGSKRFVWKSGGFIELIKANFLCIFFSFSHLSSGIKEVLYLGIKKNGYE